jgi:hypothetical protein
MPVEKSELDTLEMFNVHDAAKAAVVKARREDEARLRAHA